MPRSGCSRSGSWRSDIRRSGSGTASSARPSGSTWDRRLAELPDEKLADDVEIPDRVERRANVVSAGTPGDVENLAEWHETISSLLRKGRVAQATGEMIGLFDRAVEVMSEGKGDRSTAVVGVLRTIYTASLEALHRRASKAADAGDGDLASKWASLAFENHPYARGAGRRPDEIPEYSVTTVSGLFVRMREEYVRIIEDLRGYR